MHFYFNVWHVFAHKMPYVVDSIFAPVKIVGTCLYYSSCSIPLKNLTIEVT